ncbi:hypothetical protein [Thomasclavelia cocleata]|uniref:hypothetical protein n=1 Tax=Thomasclavelia cocleata TaxID=69824 RepID=UPI00242C9FD6|nr:hypothetical protein [Thomasclavelia cocleata]
MAVKKSRKAVNFDLNDDLLKNIILQKAIRMHGKILKDILKVKILYTVSIPVMFQMILFQWLML